MPEVANYDNEKDWMAACVPARIEEGNEQDQAVAACLNIWRERDKATNALKAVSRTDDELRVANYIVLFGGRDLEGYGSDRVNQDGSKGEYFTKHTDLTSPYTRAGVLYEDWEHGTKELPAGEVLGFVDWKTAAMDEKGVFVQRVLDRRNKYVRFVEELIDAGLVGTSSTAIPDGVQKGADGEILRWPIWRDTLTVQPMDWRNTLEFGGNVIQAFKALGIPVPEHIPEPEAEAEPEAEKSAASVAGGAGIVSQTIENKEATMPEEKETQTVDVAAIAKTAATEAVKAYQAELAKTDVPKPGGLVVVEDEADKAIKARPYKSLGEFLMDVKNAALGHVDQRLLPLRSRDTADEGGYSLNGALGDDFVGGMTKAAFARKQTGLNEGLGAMGGFLVDTDRAGGIMQRVYEVGSLLQRVDMVGVSAGSNGMTFNAVNETSRADGARQGGIRAYWTAEAGTKVPSHPAFRQIELRLHKCVGLVYATDELLQDANALESWIMTNLPEEIRFVVEDAIINGTGVGMPLGILASGAVVTQAIVVGQANATIVTPNIVGMWSRMYGPSRRNAVWLINQDIEPQLYQLQLPVGTGGQAVYMPPGGLSATPYATLMGRPVLPVEYCATLGTVGDIILVDLREYQMIEKGGMQSASSIHLQFLTDETVFRFVYRVDGQPKWNAALTPNSGSANTLSPYVVLAGRP